MAKGLKRQWELPGKTLTGDPAEWILRHRGQDPETFTRTDLTGLAAYLTMDGLDEAAELASRHILAGHKILLVADYDCDGLTSAAQFSMFLREIGHDFAIVVPTREEGYGVPMRAVREAAGAKLMIAMDCGSLDHGPISAARRAGMSVIVIDHHETKDGKTPADFLVNPKKPGCPSRFKEFCASGLTLLFLSRLRNALGCDIRLGGRYQALAALGTVADMVPLVEGNRILVAKGLEAIARDLSLPVEALAEAAGISGKEITAGRIAFQIAPRLNVGKRGMVDPMEVYRFLMEGDPKRSRDYAARLHQANRQRQMLEDAVLKDAIERLRDTPRGRALVMAGDSWEPGVLGIAASKLIEGEHHYGPVILLTLDRETGLLSGSGRSVPGVDLHGALLACEGLLGRWGGHKMAAGLSLSPGNLEAFREELEKVLAGYPAELFVPRGTVDALVSLEAIDKGFVDALAVLEPHGYGNPKPVFAVEAPICGVRTMGALNNHLEVSLGENGRRLRAVWWNGAEFRGHLEGFGNALVIGKVGWSDYWNAPEMVVEDVGERRMA
jgi:single-stranded-DNA-specific exonuclease